jgi:hypothetical protein
VSQVFNECYQKIFVSLEAFDDVNYSLATLVPNLSYWILADR